MTRTLVLIDGEHYPPVVERALDNLRSRGHDVVAALFLGGSEKAAVPPDLGVPLASGDPEALLGELIEAHRPSVIVDMSDEPILDYRGRLRLVGLSLRHGVAYEGGGFRFEPPRRPRLTHRPSVAVIGNGKRTGKTAVTIELARHWKRQGHSVCIVTMGRGGPAEPVVLEAGSFEADPAGLRRLARKGVHAASDYVEDAVFAGVDTVGTWRCGAGPSGVTVDDNFHLGASVADGLDPDVMLFEGSGAAIPPAQPDATLLVMPADLDPEFLRGYFGPYRLGLADVAIVIEASTGWKGVDRLHSAVGELRPDIDLVRASYRPEPSVDVVGKRILVATTAPPAAADRLSHDLELLGAKSVAFVHSLANRQRLSVDLDGTHTDVDAVLVEVKAAAVDVVLPWAARIDLPVALLHNRVEVEGGLDPVAEVLEANWGMYGVAPDQDTTS